LDAESSERPSTPAGRKGLAALQRVAVQSAPMSGGLMGAMMMKKVMMKSKRLRKGFPKRDEDSEGKPMQRILKLNDVVRMCSHSDDAMWKNQDRKLKKRHERIINEFRKGVVGFADDVPFLVRCFDLLDEDGFEELTTEQIMRWVNLLTDPAGVGDGDLLWVQTMGAPLGPKEIQKDLFTRVNKMPNEENPRFDWQDFVIITVDFYVLAGSAAMRRTFGELIEEPDGRSENSAGSESDGANLALVPQPPQQPKKNASLADDVRARRAAMAAKLGSDLGIADKPPENESASAAADGPDATVGSGGGRPTPPEGADAGPDNDQEVVFSCSEDTVDLTTEPLDEEKASEDESRVAEVVPQP
jgi:hypothetical protein